MDLVNTVPTSAVPEYREGISFKTDTEKTQFIETIVDRIVKMYANFLKKEWHQTKDKNLSFDRTSISKFPSEKEVLAFENRLKEKMIQVLSKEGNGHPDVSLSTDIAPTQLLQEVLTEAGVGCEYDLYLLFPTKTKTRIECNTVNKTISVSINMKNSKF